MALFFFRIVEDVYFDRLILMVLRLELELIDSKEPAWPLVQKENSYDD